MERKQAIASAQAPAAIGPYSQAISTGDFIFTSGVIPVDPATGAVDGDDIESQAERVMRNLAGLLEDADSSLSQVIKTTCFLANLDHFPIFNDIYARHFDTARHDDQPLPARSTVQVARLPLGVLVEVECVALAKQT